MELLSGERCNYFLSKLRDPDAEEIAKISSFLNKEVSCLTLWDNRLVTHQGILKDVNESQVYTERVVMPFKGYNTGVLTITCDGDELYSVL